MKLAILVAILALIAACSSSGDGASGCNVTSTAEVSGTLIAQCADGSVVVCDASTCADQGGFAGDVNNQPTTTTNSNNPSPTTNTTSTTNNHPAG